MKQPSSLSISISFYLVTFAVTVVMLLASAQFALWQQGEQVIATQLRSHLQADYGIDRQDRTLAPLSLTIFKQIAADTHSRLTVYTGDVRLTCPVCTSKKNVQQRFLHPGIVKMKAHPQLQLTDRSLETAGEPRLPTGLTKKIHHLQSTRSHPGRKISSQTQVLHLKKKADSD